MAPPVACSRLLLTSMSTNSSLWINLIPRSLTVFSDPLERIRTGKTARVPFVIGNTQDDGTIVAVGLTDLSAFLDSFFAGLVTADEVRPLYPGLNDSSIISAVSRDELFLW